MKIYIDFDDVICETAGYFTKLAEKLFEIRVPYEEIHDFDLRKSFDLNGEQYEELMRVGHLPEHLLAYDETPGASETINKWVDEGHEVFVITGRPFNCYEASRKWLDDHQLKRIPLYCVDKYGREIFKKNCTYSMTLEQLYEMTFDLAIEDSPMAFDVVKHFENCRVAVFDRPWNKQAEFPDDCFGRYNNWQEIKQINRKRDE